jgi:hypothetical protein
VIGRGCVDSLPIIRGQTSFLARGNVAVARNPAG